MVAIKDIDEVKLEDPDYYRVKNIPGTGCYLKKEDDQNKQLSFNAILNLEGVNDDENGR